MYAIAGATGNTGAIVASRLLAEGKRVRVIVRDPQRAGRWRARGAEIATAALDDTAAVAAALAGVAGAYLMVPPRPGSPTPLDDQRAQVDALAAAVRAAGTPHVVLLSSIGAHRAGAIGALQVLHHAEAALGAAGAALTVVRAATFMETWRDALGLLGRGVLPTFVPGAIAFPMVAVRDVGRIAADALGDGGDGRRVIELAGPREYSARDVAAALANLLGTPVTAIDTPLTAVISTLTHTGQSLAWAELRRDLYAGIIDGSVAWQGAGTQAMRGQIAIAEVLRPLLAR